VLRQHFYHQELDPGFRVADATEAALLQNEALDELFERLYREGDESFAQLVDHYGGERDDSVLQELVLKLYNFSRSHPRPEAWLEEVAGYFCGAATIEQLPWGRELLHDLEVELTGVRAELQQASSLARLPGGPQAYVPTLENELDLLEKAIAACRRGWDSACCAFQEISFKRLKAARDADPALREQVQQLRGAARSRLERLRTAFFLRSEAEWLADLARVGPLMAALVQLVKDFAALFRQLKASRVLVDFSDLEHLCLGVLRETGRYRERFVEVLVDEYQDINPVQEAILELVSRGDNRFMVGDVKQSIYRFRLAEPGLFLEKYRRFPPGPGGEGRRVDLSLNFRSRCPLIEGINLLFKRIMTPYCGELEYDAAARLVYGADYPEEDGENLAGGIELRIIEPGAGRNNPEIEESGLETAPGATAGDSPETPAAEAHTGYEADNLEELETAQVEARWIIWRLRRLMGGGFKVYDRRRREYRRLRYRDVVILLRSTRGWAPVFAEELQQAGIPVFADLGSGYFNATEVETMISLLQIIDNPRQDIPLAGVLRAPWVGLTAEDLAQVRLHRREGEFYEALLAAANEDTPLALRLRRFKQQLDRWRDLARRVSLADLIWNIYQETGYYDYVGGMPGGSQRQANLRALHDRARQYEATSFRGLFRFLRFIERLQESGQDLGTARVLGENEDVVRIMSIHKSKGLEFPVVFVAGLGKPFNLRDLNQRLLLHRDLGLGPELVDPDRCLHYPTLAKLAIRSRLIKESLAEELRILYVAMTRAEQKLIMVGSLSSPLKTGAWEMEAGTADQPLPDHLLAAARKPLDWIIPALLPICREASGWSLRNGPADEVFTCGGATAGEAPAASPAPPAAGTPEAALPPGLTPAAAASSADFDRLVARRLSWRYPYSEQGQRAAKLSVTEAKQRLVLIQPGDAAGPSWELPLESFPGAGEPASLAWVRPRFLQQAGGLTAAERGSVMHLVMQHLDLNFLLDEEEIRLQLNRLVDEEVLTPAQVEAVDLSAVAAFFRSPLGRRLAAAEKVYRELPFILGLPAREVYP
ncbi:MAG: UvrD-helicase domain-containing protein, partial [Syntrophomonadaceae bacterium]|nr:UvrD-helicase domain-containing protein [Syntrophomonadaceae bacterium]